MALKTAAQYNADLLARAPTLEHLGELIWDRIYAERDPRTPLQPEEFPTGMPVKAKPEMNVRLGKAVLPDLLLVLGALNIGQLIVDALADAEVLPSGVPPLTINDGAGVTRPVVGKGKLQ